MAKANVFVVSPGGFVTPPSVTLRSEAAATAIYTGEPVKQGGTGNNYVIPSADAEPVTTSATFVGIAATDSVHTASADGDIDVTMALPGMVFGCKAKTSTTFDTQAEIDALLTDKVLFDLTSSTYTVDVTSAGANNGLVIVGGDPVDAVVYFAVRSGCTIWA